jgi:hypothetical protein
VEQASWNVYRFSTRTIQTLEVTNCDLQSGPLAQTPPDYSDIPPLFGEDWLSARLVEIVCRHCGTTGDELYSHAIPAHADLMSLCAEAWFIEITLQCDGLKPFESGCKSDAASLADIFHLRRHITVRSAPNSVDSVVVRAKCEPFRPVKPARAHASLSDIGAARA